MLKMNGINPRCLKAALLSAVITLGLSACSDGTSSESTSPATRSVEHAHGTAEVPENPGRVVVLEPVQLDTSVALGIIPIGAAVLNETAGIPKYLGDQAQEADMVGTVADPDIEAIAALQPDLILGTESRHSQLFDKLNAIAPTAFMKSQTDPWQDNVAFVAEALGKPQGGSDVLTQYQEHCTTVAQKIGNRGRTAQLIRPRDNKFSLYGPASFAGSTLECAGYTIPDQEWEDISVDVAKENLSSVNADLVLVTSATPDSDTETQKTVIEALGQSNNDSDVHLVDRSLWITGVGPLGGQAVLDSLVALVNK